MKNLYRENTLVLACVKDVLGFYDESAYPKSIEDILQDIVHDVEACRGNKSIYSGAVSLVESGKFLCIYPQVHAFLYSNGYDQRVRDQDKLWQLYKFYMTKAIVYILKAERLGEQVWLSKILREKVTPGEFRKYNRETCQRP